MPASTAPFVKKSKDDELWPLFRIGGMAHFSCIPKDGRSFPIHEGKTFSTGISAAFGDRSLPALSHVFAVTYKDGTGYVGDGPEAAIVHAN